MNTSAKPQTTEDLSDAQIERFARHLILDEVADEGQLKLLNASVLVVGAGGIGCPVLQYLASSGIGRITILDDDTIDLSNLQRQVLFKTEDIGCPKSTTAKAWMLAINPECQAQALTERLDVHNATSLLSAAAYDLVIDGSDSYETRSLVASTCLALRIPLVSAAASQFDGQLAFFKPWLNAAPCYHCLFPQAPAGRTSCADVGIFAPVTGMLGTMAANMALQALLGMPVNYQRLLLVDGLNFSFMPIKSGKRANCEVCHA